MYSRSSKIALGTVQFGLDYGICDQARQVASPEVGRILEYAQKVGIKLIDTAAAYGTSEKVIGGFSHLANTFEIVTKILPLNGENIRKVDIERIEQRFYESLRYLNVKSVYGTLAHRPEDLLMQGGEQIFAAMQSWKSQGLADRIGVSVYTKHDIDRLLDRYTFDIIQIPFSIFDQRLLRAGSIKQMASAKIEIHARSTFLQGLLLMPPKDIPPFFAPIKPQILRFQETMIRDGLTPLSGALAFVSSIPEIAQVVIGVHSTEHLRQCVESSQFSLQKDYSEFALEDEIYLDPRCWKRS